MKKIFLTLFFLAFLLITPKVQAAGNVSLSANKSSVNIGEEFTVSISLSGAEVASLTARVTVDTSKVEFVSGPSNSNFRNGRIIYTWTDPNGGDSPLKGGTIATFTLKARTGGIAGFSVSGDFYAPDESAINLNFSGVNVTVKEPITPPPVTPAPATSVPETPEPEVPVTPNPTEVVAQTPTPEPESTPPPVEPEPTIIQETPNTPEQTLKPATPANTPTQSDNPATNETQSSNTNLKSLRLDVATINPNFAPDLLQYEAIVNESINNIDVLAVPEDSRSTISITGNNDLEIGRNLIQITVIAQSGDKKTYNLTVNKTSEADNLNSYLENLAIENVFLVPEFKPDVFRYNADIESTQNNVKILAIPQIEGATVSIEGQDNISYGNNTITITVTSKNGASTSTYSILTYRKTEDEELAEREKTQIDEETLENDDNKELNEEKRENKAGSIILAVIVTLGAISLSGVLTWKYLKEKKN